MSKDEQTALDEYFRKKEADIPVPFDPQHWQQLAAALDRAARPEPPPAPRKSFRGVKGWWVSGLWLLAFLTSAWVLMQYASHTDTMPAVHRPVEEKPLAPAAPPTVSERTGEGAVLPSVPDAVLPPSDGSANQRSDAMPAAGASQGEVTEKTGLEAVDTNALRAPLPIRLDSTATPPAPAKKKKHLFW